MLLKGMQIVLCLFCTNFFVTARGYTIILMSNNLQRGTFVLAGMNVIQKNVL